MKDLLIALLTALGASDETLEIVKGDDEAKIKALKAEDVGKEISDAIKEVLQEDEDFLKPIKSDTIRGVLAKREQELLNEFKTYLTKEEVSALPEKNRYDAAVKLLAKKVKEKAKEGTTPDDKDKEIDRLNAELEKRDGVIKEYEEVKLPGAIKEMEGKMTQKEIDIYLRNSFSEIGEDLVAKPSGLYPAAHAAMTAKYDFKKEDDGSVTLLEKGKTTKARNGTKEIAVKEAFRNLSEENGWLKKSLPVPDRKPVPDGGPDKKLNLSGKEKFEEALKEKEAQVAAGQ